MSNIRKSLVTTKGKDDSRRTKSFVAKDGLNKSRTLYKNNGKISKY